MDLGVSWVAFELGREGRLRGEIGGGAMREGEGRGKGRGTAECWMWVLSVGRDA